MDLQISRIFLFGRDGEVKTVKLTDGLNIITGDSKTGKSAIIEIIDYCLFAGRSTIPKGIINDWVNLFCLVLKHKEKYLILARPSSKYEDGQKSYFNFETSDFFLETFSNEYFNTLDLKNYKENQLEFEKHLGISVLDTRIDSDDDLKAVGGKVTMRSFIPFLFQHQNLIANKHSLFYRFDDHYKRRKTIDDFSILMGWETNEYFLIKRELEEKTKQLNTEKKLHEKLKIGEKQLKSEIEILVASYYDFIGQKIGSNLELNELKRLALNLPEVTKRSFADSRVKSIYNEKLKTRTKLKNTLDETIELLDKLKSNTSLSSDYNFSLNRLKSFVSFPILSSELECPLCNNTVNEVSEKIKSISESKELLIEEFEKIGNYTIDSSKEIENLAKERDRIKKEIISISSEIINFENQLKEADLGDSYYERAYILKGVTKANINNIIQRGNLLNSNPKNVIDLEIEISNLKAKLLNYNIEEKIKKAENILNDKMTDICNKLDFEKELRPGKLLFSFKDFSFKYHFDDKENILLTEMGSGSNWLAIHLSVFLGFLHLNSITEKSAIPSILVLDQPSQVYFPTKYGSITSEDNTNNPKDLAVLRDENIEQVKNIFRVLVDEIDLIFKESKYKPQIIVLEHADEEEFNDFVRYRWKKDGEKLI